MATQGTYMIMLLLYYIRVCIRVVLDSHPFPMNLYIVNVKFSGALPASGQGTPDGTGTPDGQQTPNRRGSSHQRRRPSGLMNLSDKDCEALR